jgi:hypothetical protein
MSGSPTGIESVRGTRRPPQPSFGTSRGAVESYLSLVLFAYEVANSDTASLAFTPDEEVRVDSYLQLDTGKNQRIQQRLVTFTSGKERAVGTTTLLPAREQWHYQYRDLKSPRSVNPTFAATYDTTYALTPREGGGWLVDSVEAKPLGEIK